MMQAVCLPYATQHIANVKNKLGKISTQFSSLLVCLLPVCHEPLYRCNAKQLCKLCVDWRTSVVSHNLAHCLHNLQCHTFVCIICHVQILDSQIFWYIKSLQLCTAYVPTLMVPAVMLAQVIAIQHALPLCSSPCAHYF